MSRGADPMAWLGDRFTDLEPLSTHVLGLTFGRGMALGGSLFLTFFPALFTTVERTSDLVSVAWEFGEPVDDPASQPMASKARRRHGTK